VPVRLEGVDLRTATFTPATSIELLNAACRVAGLDPGGARLLRHHTNAVYRLARHPVVVKITRPGAGRDRSIRTVAVAEALNRTAVPSVRLWPGLTQPIAAANSYATFWKAVDVTREPAAPDLAEPLHRLHHLDQQTVPALPELDPFAAVTSSLTRPTVLGADDLTFLRDYADQLAQDYVTLDFERPSRLIHGDAHHSNMLVGSDGPLLADWESVRVGPPEWDLVTVAVHCRRFEHPLGEYDEFAKRYGRDIHTWPGYRTLAAVRELRMITTNSWKSVPGTPAAREVLKRVAALRDGDKGRRWKLL